MHLQELHQINTRITPASIADRSLVPFVATNKPGRSSLLLEKRKFAIAIAIAAGPKHNSNGHT
jgi:hypothetical protein